MPARANPPTANDPRAILAALIEDPAEIPSLTIADVADVTGRTRSQISHAVWNGDLHRAYGSQNRHRVCLFAPAEVARWIKGGDR